jgi:hypothetical protein
MQIEQKTKLITKIIFILVVYLNPYISTIGKLLGSIGTAYSVFTNLNKLDDPNATQKDKAVDIAKAVTAAVTGFIPNPVVCPIPNAVIDTASYFADLQEGRKMLHQSQQTLILEQIR